MTVLAIDTALASLRLALAGRGVERVAVADMPRGHAEALFPAIEALLQQAGLAAGQLSRIAVNIGPGSFTGTRVGVAAAKGLALALEVPLHGITTLQALATEAAGEPCAVIMDARRGEVYFQLFAADGAGDPPALVPVDDLAQVDLSGRRLVGSGLDWLEGRYPQEMLMPRQFADPLAIAGLAARGVGLGRGAPFYLRGPDAKPQLHKVLPRAGRHAG